LVKKVYTSTRDKDGKNAEQFLSNFYINKHKPPKEESLKPEDKQKDINKNRKEKLDLDLLTDYNSLLLMSYRNNNFITFPYITDKSNLKFLKEEGSKYHIIPEELYKKPYDNLTSLKAMGKN